MASEGRQCARWGWRSERTGGQLKVVNSPSCAVILVRGQAWCAVRKVTSSWWAVDATVRQYNIALISWWSHPHLPFVNCLKNGSTLCFQLTSLSRRPIKRPIWKTYLKQHSFLHHLKAGTSKKVDTPWLWSVSLPRRSYRLYKKLQKCLNFDENAPTFVIW